MKIDRQKLLLTMARACMSPADLQTATQLPRPTLNNAMGGRRSVRNRPGGKSAGFVRGMAGDSGAWGCIGYGCRLRRG